MAPSRLLLCFYCIQNPWMICDEGEDEDAFRNDIAAWCIKTGNELENISVSGDETTATIVKG